MNDIYGSPKTGPYSNLPFKVKGTMIPFGVTFFGVLGFFFAFPFLTTYWHLKKAGSFDM
jgi:cytochrome c oxidase subunit 7c